MQISVYILPDKQWNILGDNDASFNDGSGIADSALVERHYTPGSVTSEKLSSTIAFAADISSQSIPNETFTKLNFDTLLFDRGGDFSTTNNQFTAPKSGIYLFSAFVTMDSINASRSILQLYKNSSELSRVNAARMDGDSDYTLGGATIINLNAGDVVDIRLWHNHGGSNNVETGGSHYNEFSAILIG